MILLFVGLHRVIISQITSLHWQILLVIQEMHEELLAKCRFKPEGSEDPDHTPHDVKTVIEFAAAEAARAALRQLTSKLDGWAGSKRIKLIIYFDEANSLVKVVLKTNDEKTYYAHVSTNLFGLSIFFLRLTIDKFELSPVRFSTGPCQVCSHSW